MEFTIYPQKLLITPTCSRFTAGIPYCNRLSIMHESPTKSSPVSSIVQDTSGHSLPDFLILFQVISLPSWDYWLCIF